MGDTRTQLIETLTIGTLPGKTGTNGIHITEVIRALSQTLQTTARRARVIGQGHFLPHFYKTTQAITQLSIPTHAQLQRQRLKFIKNHLKKLLHVSVFDHLQGITMSSLKSLLLLTTGGCFYAKSGDVAACRVVCIGLYLKSA